MHVALRPADRTDASLVYLQQIGVESVIAYTYDLPLYEKAGVIDADELTAMRQQVEKHGMRLAMIALDQRVLSNLLLGLPGADEDLDKLCRSIAAMGRAGVRFLNYSLLVSRAISNRYGHPLPGHNRVAAGRGGALVLRYDDAQARQAKEYPAGKVSADEMWARIRRFAERCVPVAEAAGVVLGLHPDDPPVSEYWGVKQVLNSMKGLDEFLALAPSPCNCLNLCQGTIQEAGINVLDYIRKYGPQGKIGHVELRGVLGTVPNYTEDFMDGGDLRVLDVLKTLKSVGYTGPLEVAHVPRLIDDPRRRVVQAWSTGYLRGLLALPEGSA
ncbi:MAG: hypothetical protein EXS37_09030 [Opitutus sp.]|nr:hypothetical protein [Opitutus sp.]